MSALSEAGERFVAAATSKFAKFEADRDTIGSAVVKAMKAGELDRRTATDLWLDRDNCLSLPLQRRYAEAGAWESLLAFHLRRLKQHGRKDPWPDALAEPGLRAMIAAGRPADAMTLVRAYGNMQLKRLRQDLKSRNRRGPRGEVDDQTRRALDAFGQAIAAAIPDRKRELMRDMESVEPLVHGHGSDEDRAWFEAIRRELWMERRA